MLASRQAGMHGNQAGDPWKHSRAADKGSLVLSMRQTRCERWPCHTHRGELREAASGASRGGCPGPTPPAAASEEGAKTPPGSLSCPLTAESTAEAVWCFVTFPSGAAGWNGGRWSGAGRCRIHPTSSPAPSGRGDNTALYIKLRTITV